MIGLYISIKLHLNVYNSVQTLLLVDLLLTGDELVLLPALSIPSLVHTAVRVGDLHTVRASHRATAHTASGRTVSRHLGPGARQRAVVKVLDLRHHATVSLHGGEVNLLVLDTALLPRHGAAVLLPGPYLVPVIINLPVSDAVVLSNVLTDGDLLDVRLLELPLLAVPHVEVLVSCLALSSTPSRLLHLAVSVSVHVADHLRDVHAHFLLLLLAPELVVAARTAVRLLSVVLDVVVEGHVAAVAA